MVRPGASAKPVSAATVARATVRMGAAYSPRCCAWSPLPVGWYDGGIRDGMPQRDEQIEAGRTAVESVLLVRPRSATKLLEGVPRKKENVVAAQEQLLIRAKANGLATLGKYGGDASGSAAAGDSLHVEGYVY